MESIRTVQEAAAQYKEGRDVLVCYGMVNGKEVHFNTHILPQDVREEVRDTVKKAFVESTSCNDRWTEFHGSCYLFAHGGSLSFFEAEHYCNQHGGHLVHINNQAENLFVKDYLRSIKADDTWIGLTDEGSEGLWEWYDTHTSPSFTDWYPGEPNAQNGDKDCVAVKSGLDFHWFDDVCSWQKTPLCEMTGGIDIIG